MQNNDALTVRLELEAKSGSDNVCLMLFPGEVEYLLQEGLQCNSKGGNYYAVSWSETFSDVLLPVMKQLISSYEPKNLAEKLALATTATLLNM